MRTTEEIISQIHVEKFRGAPSEWTKLALEDMRIALDQKKWSSSTTFDVNYSELNKLTQLAEQLKALGFEVAYKRFDLAPGQKETVEVIVRW